MMEQNELRLLPWSGPEGKPCYLSTDDSDSYMSRLADEIEADQLFMAADLLKRAVRDLVDDRASTEDVRQLAKELTGALRDALRVAVSRGFPSVDLERVLV
ncbi:hypothetical protein ACFYPN_06005 [Streptomyces sp. NPDC005576]|uniref:hypothetical protein n=1 Tax=Streptomyces sp. NPDC005576 TaxID=3364726 RepID=UPI0036878971